MSALGSPCSGRREGVPGSLRKHFRKETNFSSCADNDSTIPKPSVAGNVMNKKTTKARPVTSRPFDQGPCKRVASARGPPKAAFRLTKKICLGIWFLSQRTYYWKENLVLEKTSEWKKLAKLAGWSPMDLPVKWHFPEYKFDMK